MAVYHNEEATISFDDHDPKTEIAALVRIACNKGNSLTLRDMACEHLAQKVSNSPQLAVFAAQELLAKCDAGTAPDTVFDALIKLIRQARFATSALFHDAIEAVSGTNKKTRTAAANRIMQALGVRRRNLSSAAA